LSVVLRAWIGGSYRVGVGHKRASWTDVFHSVPRRRPASSFATARVYYGRVAITHVLSVEVGAIHAFSLADRLASASAERFRSEVIVHHGGVWEVRITARDVSAELTRALLSTVRDFLGAQEVGSARVHADGREYVLSP
jgi:hypothetical protein